MKKKAFTLIEILIALVLIAILFTVIFRSYVTITEITTRLQNEKKINTEIAYVTQTVQNIADGYQIDFARYQQAGINLMANQGRTSTLYVTGAGTGALYFTGGNLFREQSGNVVALVTSGNATVTQGRFKLIPFTVATGSSFLDIQHPGFRMFLDIQLAQFMPSQWIWNVQSSMQQFYNLQRVE